MFPSRSATSPCGPDPGVLRGNSLICPVFGSKRPSLFAIWPVYHSDPSGATAGSCGLELGVGTSHSLMETLGFPAAITATTANANHQNEMTYELLHMFR